MVAHTNLASISGRTKGRAVMEANTNQACCCLDWKIYVAFQGRIQEKGKGGAKSIEREA